MTKQLPAILLGCLAIAVALLITQVMVLQNSIVELSAKFDSAFKDRQAMVAAPGSESELHFDSAIHLLKTRGERIVPISDPSIHRAMEIDRLQRIVPRKRFEAPPSIEYLPSEGNELKEFTDLLPESVK